MKYSTLTENGSIKKRITVTMRPELEREIRMIQAESMMSSPKSFSQVVSMLLIESLQHRESRISSKGL